MEARKKSIHFAAQTQSRYLAARKISLEILQLIGSHQEDAESIPTENGGSLTEQNGKKAPALSYMIESRLD